MAEDTRPLTEDEAVAAAEDALQEELPAEVVEDAVGVALVDMAGGRTAVVGKRGADHVRREAPEVDAKAWVFQGGDAAGAVAVLTSKIVVLVVESST